MQTDAEIRAVGAGGMSTGPVIVGETGVLEDRWKATITSGDGEAAW